MKKHLLIFALLTISLSAMMGQTPIDRAMSVWARDIVNENFTEVFADVYDLENPPHAAMGFSDSSSTISMTQNTWAVITNAASDLWTTIETVGITIAGDTMTINESADGDYLISASVSFSGANTDVYEFAGFVNGVLATPKMEWSVVNGVIFNVSIPFYVDLEGGDGVSLRIRNTANNNDATMVSGALTIFRLHK